MPILNQYLMKAKKPYTVPNPKGYTNKDLETEGSSVLGAVYLAQDLNLIIEIVERTFGDDAETNIKNIHKIFHTVTSSEWQNRYNGIFIYMYQYYIRMQSPKFVQSEKARLQFAYACMLLEGYIHRTWFPSEDRQGKIGTRVVKPIFDELYKDFNVTMGTQNAMLIGDIRNGITHQGGLSNLSTSLTPTGYNLAMNVYKKNPQNLRDLDHFLNSYVYSFNYLFEDMMLRFLGLTQNELGTNLRPPCMLSCWRPE